MLKLREDVTSKNERVIADIVTAIVKAAKVPLNKTEVVFGKWSISLVRKADNKCLFTFDYNIVDDEDGNRVSLLLNKWIDKEIGASMLSNLLSSELLKMHITHIVMCDIPESCKYLVEGWEVLPDKYDVLFDLSGGEEPSIGSFWKEVV